MSRPSELQFKHVQDTVARLSIMPPIHIRRLEDDSIQFNAGSPYVFQSADGVDALLNEVADLDSQQDDDELYDQMVELLERYGECSY